MSGSPEHNNQPHDPLAAESGYTDDFRRRLPTLWWATLVGPPLLTLALLTYLWFDRGYEFVVKLIGTALATFFGLGRFVILFGSEPKVAGAPTIRDAEAVASLGGEQVAKQFEFLTRTELFVMVTWMDLLAASMLIFHLGFLFRIPKIGPSLARVREEGEFFMHTQPWMRRFTFIGLTAFVMIPIAATGSVGGAIFGRLLGMSRAATLLAIVSGTLLGNGVMLVAGKAIAQSKIFNPQSPISLIIGLSLVIGIILLINWRYQKMKSRWKDGGGPSPTR